MERIGSIFAVLALLCMGCKSDPPGRPVGVEDPGLYTGPIIDMHMHTGLPHPMPAGTPAPCRPWPCEGGGAAVQDPDTLLTRCLDAMDRHHITLAFLSGTDRRAVQRWHAAAPKRFIRSPFIIVPDPVDLDTLRAEYAADKYQGMGELGSQLAGIPPNDPRLDPYFQLAEERDLPVLIHTLGIGPYVPRFRSAAGDPLLLEDVLVRHPDLRLFVENAGFPYTENMIAMMYQYPQLHGDLSTISWVVPREAFHDHLRKLMRAGLGKRLMFGTDQMAWPDKIGEAVSAIQEAPFLTREEKRDIFYDNAARFLHLEGFVPEPGPESL